MPSMIKGAFSWFQKRGSRFGDIDGTSLSGRGPADLLVSPLATGAPVSRGSRRVRGYLSSINSGLAGCGLDLVRLWNCCAKRLGSFPFPIFVRVCIP